ncbi:uncharacterized protein BDR25DRAFT_395809 [Lindgomyces ingoldianus]|uniref:Uncharacterized protein n=1 Tax=Lindgomyces ingoldianus TaxID=673940 RepID=A0ACB6QIJ2_9PLEO|nr:uncharacterized protein BDR25DRAFT_395809 [Lindgomyces ingoldianus]KAF2466330.1 hypothetical protein BDR25DRAFT_395809 [Lindgomyces ingoldianus]
MDHLHLKEIGKTYGASWAPTRAWFQGLMPTPRSALGLIRLCAGAITARAPADFVRIEQHGSRATVTTEAGREDPALRWFTQTLNAHDASTQIRMPVSGASSPFTYSQDFHTGRMHCGEGDWLSVSAQIAKVSGATASFKLDFDKNSPKRIFAKMEPVAREVATQLPNSAEEVDQDFVDHVSQSTRPNCDAPAHLRGPLLGQPMHVRQGFASEAGLSRTEKPPRTEAEEGPHISRMFARFIPLIRQLEREDRSSSWFQRQVSPTKPGLIMFHTGYSPITDPIFAAFSVDMSSEFFTWTHFLQLLDPPDIVTFRSAALQPGCYSVTSRDEKICFRRFLGCFSPKNYEAKPAMIELSPLARSARFVVNETPQNHVVAESINFWVESFRSMKKDQRKTGCLFTIQLIRECSMTPRRDGRLTDA